MLQQRLRGVLRARRRLLPFYSGNIIPTMTDLAPGARTMVQDQVLEYGEAQLMAPDADDIPLVEVTSTENEYRIVMPVAGFAVTYSETLAQGRAAANGIQYNPRDIKMTAATRVIEEKCSDVAAFGSTDLNFTGMVNNASVTLNDSSFDPFDAGSTADDIADWFLGEIGSIAVNTNTVEYPTAALISTSLRNLMVRRRMPDSGDNILSYVLRTQREATNSQQQGIKDIFALPELESAKLEAAGAQSSGTNKDRIVLYPYDPEVLEKHIMSGAIDMFPEDWVVNKGARKIYPMYTCMSQTIINFPGALRYIDHAKEA
jgi:hypothetical protein